MTLDSEPTDDFPSSSDTAATERNPGKFRPKPRGGNTLTAPVASSSSPPAAPESRNAEEEVLAVDRGSSLEDAFIVCGMDLLGEDVQPASTTATVGRFQPKAKLKPKAKKAVARPAAAVTGVTESIGVPMPDSSNSAPDVGSFESNVTQDPLHTMGEPFLHTKLPQDGVHISEGHTSLQGDSEMPTTETTTTLDGMEVFEDTVFQPTSTSGQSVVGFQSELSGKATDTQPGTSVSNHGATDASSEWDFPMDNEPLEDHGLCFAGDTSKWSTDAMPTNLGQQAPGNDNIEEQTTHITDKNATEAVENHESSRLSMKLRKRKNASTPEKHDGGASEDWDVGSPDISQMDGDHNDDECRDEDMTKQKRTSRKSKEQKADNQKKVRRRKKAAEDTDSTQQAPPKKKFPHGTRRRRQVDKALLEMPEEEIDPRQLKIKDLIMLAEAKERISSKQAPTLATDQGKEDSFQYNFDDEEQDPESDNDYEAHRRSLQNTTKLNYHTYMNRPKSGRWSKLETEEFYEAIRQFGTNFEMIQQLFPNRTRHQVKLKYKNEEKKNPLLLGDAILKRSSDDNSCYKRLIEQLQTQAEENSQQEENGDPTTFSQDAADGNEEWGAEPEKKTRDGFEGEKGNTSKHDDDDWDQDDPNASNFNGYEDSNWDFDASPEKYSAQEANGSRNAASGNERLLQIMTIGMMILLQIMTIGTRTTKMLQITTDIKKMMIIGMGFEWASNFLRDVFDFILGEKI
ncbi:uncharacterized protein M6B38_154425 [Iris pallida]|uniref:SANT domain-containing protein n=1 Tax=Iris pallida TaxID=29817 RepID=A0AAX6F4X7_IRIPA|nr:uncharacterized protein M6B38_154425 [Iris pallida]